ncbi:MAG TPA: hypothetical protein VLZ11_02070 [Flavobacterium sp.]|nr:hypothetical protein [Flavobacterium sp.]
MSDKITRHYLELIAQRDQALKENDLKRCNHIKEELHRLKKNYAEILNEVVL